MLLLQAERPDTMLGIVCGALHVADASFQKSMSDFLHSLERSVDAITSVSPQFLMCVCDLPIETLSSSYIEAKYCLQPVSSILSTWI